MNRGYESCRLFLAVKLSMQVKENLLQLKAAVPEYAGLKWTCEQNLHLTLRFIGDWPVAGLPVLISSVGKLRFKPLELEVKGLGLFKRAQQTILWAGFAEAALLQRLKTELDQLLESGCALPGEKGAYTPHITLARLKRTGASLPSQVELEKLRVQAQGQSFGKFSAAGFSLFKSELHPQGVRHTVIHDFPQNID